MAYSSTADGRNQRGKYLNYALFWHFIMLLPAPPSYQYSTVVSTGGQGESRMGPNYSSATIETVVRTAQENSQNDHTHLPRTPMATTNDNKALYFVLDPTTNHFNAHHT